MMNFFTENLEFLRMQDPELTRRLEQVPDSLKAIQDEGGAWNLTVNDKAHPSGWLYANVSDSIRCLQENMMALRNPQLILLLGLGLGHHLQALLDKPHPFTKFIIIVEPSLEMFRLYLSLADRRAQLSDDRILWIVGVPPSEISHHLESFQSRPYFVGSSQYYTLIEWGYENEYHGRFKTVWGEFEEFLSSQININFIDSYYGFMNFTDNWNRVVETPRLQEYKGLFRGKPGIIVGSGPSLNGSIEVLRRLQDKAVLFASGSAYPLLKKHDIQCHFVSCIERDPDMSVIFRGVDTKGTYLVASPIVHREVFNIYEGSVINMDRSLHFLPAVYPDGEFDDLPVTNVSHVALQSLHILGCSPIFLMGQDLALDPVTQETHAANYIEPISYSQKLELSGRTVEVPSNRDDGSFVATWSHWHEYGQGITRLIRHYGIECYNVLPPEYGIRIEGTKRIDPDEAFVSRFQESLAVKASLDRTTKHFKEAIGPKYRKQAEAFLPRAMDLLNRLEGFCLEEGQRIYDFQGSNNGEAYRSLLLRMQEAFLKPMADPLFKTLIMPVVTAKWSKAMIQSASLRGSDDGDTEVCTEKLSIPLYWFSEIIIRTRMMRRRLQMIIDGAKTSVSVRDGFVPPSSP